MSTLSLRLPESLHKRLAELAKRDNVSINQLISSAVAEKMSALDTAEYLQARGSRGSRTRFEAVLAKVPDVEPDEQDRLPNKRLQRTAAGERAKRGGSRRRRGSKGGRR